MKFKPGDKVWVHSSEGGEFPNGEFEGVVTRYNNDLFDPGYPYLVDVPACPYPWPGGRTEIEWVCQECDLRPRGDDKIKRQELGEWDLCPWRPERVTVGKDGGR